jgi:hypothetical protein
VNQMGGAGANLGNCSNADEQQLCFSYPLRESAKGRASKKQEVTDHIYGHHALQTQIKPA